jgi:2-amino-4-hydroxy-6-hydroxymethyldihydropteridine diphosphokinase
VCEEDHRVQVLVGLGGNQGDVAAVFAHAVAALSGEAQQTSCSSLWRSAAQGPPQPDFINAAVLLDTELRPFALFDLCHRLEAEAGRVRDASPRWGPRPLDLDLLLIAGVVLESPRLVVPHPRLAFRRFALLPAAEVAPSWVHPRLHRSLAELAADPALAAQRCERLGPFPNSS